MVCLVNAWPVLDALGRREEAMEYAARAEVCRLHGRLLPDGEDQVAHPLRELTELGDGWGAAEAAVDRGRQALAAEALGRDPRPHRDAGTSMFLGVRLPAGCPEADDAAQGLAPRA